MEVIAAVPGVEFVVDVEMEAAAGHEAGVEVASAVELELELGLGAVEVVENVVDAGAGVGNEAEGRPEVAAALVHVLDAAVIAG